MTDEKETPEVEETGAEAKAAEETAEAEAAEEVAEGEVAEKAAEAEAAEEVAEEEVAEEAAEAETAEEVAEAKAEPPKEKGYTRRQLEHMTAKRLRDLALDLKEISGIHGMKKDELVEAIFALRGVVEAEGVSALAVDKGAIKQEIRQLKGLRTTALEAGDSTELKRVRNRIKRLKRTLRKVS